MSSNQQDEIIDRYYPLSGKKGIEFDEWINQLCKGNEIRLRDYSYIEYYFLDKDGVLKKRLEWADGRTEEKNEGTLKTLCDLINDIVVQNYFMLTSKGRQEIPDVKASEFKSYIDDFIKPNLRREYEKCWKSQFNTLSYSTNEPPSDKKLYKDKGLNSFIGSLKEIKRMNLTREAFHEKNKSIEADSVSTSQKRELPKIRVKRVYPNNIEKLKNRLQKGLSREPDVKYITGMTDPDEGTINVGDDLIATTNIGVKRDNQEDAVLLYRDNHTKLKMAVVADGMGGLDYGEDASHRAVRYMENWIKSSSLPEKETLYNLDEDSLDIIKSRISDELDSLSSIIRRKSHGGTTLLLALKGKKNTLIVNVGDSRALAVKVSEGPCSIEEVSYEDSEANQLFEDGVIPVADLKRFYKRSNIITSCLGRQYEQDPHFYMLPNKEYDILLLTTDGVTDCLSDNELLIACCGTDKKQLSKRIVECATQNESNMPYIKSNLERFDELYYSNIPGGKDNATVATVFNKSEFNGR